MASRPCVILGLLLFLQADSPTQLSEEFFNKAIRTPGVSLAKTEAVQRSIWYEV